MPLNEGKPVSEVIRIVDRFSDTVRRQLSSASPGFIHNSIKQWGEIYRSFAQERYYEHSRGSSGEAGDKRWAALSPETIKRRRQGEGEGLVAAILIDEAILVAGLDRNLNVAKGGYEEFIRNGIRVGYGGPARHPKDGSTLADIAAGHQSGIPKKRLPARPIIVQPPPRVLKIMTDVTEAELRREWERTRRTA